MGDSKRTEFQRMYSILAGLLFDIDLLNIYATREDYPDDLISKNEHIINMLEFIKNVHREEHITLTWNRYKELISKKLNSPVETLDDDPNAEAYYTLWEKAEECYISEVKDKEYSQKWKAELKWMVEYYIKNKSKQLAKFKYYMLDHECFGGKCEKPCDVIAECRKCLRAKADPVQYAIEWHEIQEQKLKSIKSASQANQSISYGENVEDRIKKYKEESQQKKNGREILGMSTGIKTIDELTDGFLMGHIMAVLARTGMGKSALVLQMAIDAWVKENVNCLFINLEIPIWDIQKRLDTSLTKTPYNTVRRSLWKNQAEEDAFYEKLRTMNANKPNKFVVEDAYDLNMQGLDQLMRRYYNRWGQGFIVVLDNLNRMSFPAGMKKHEGGNEICVKYHKLCKEFNARGILVAQLNRTAEGITRPGLLNSSHTRDSDQLLDSVSTAFALVNYLGKDKKRVIPMKGRDFDMDAEIILQNNLWRMRMEEIEGDGYNNPSSGDFTLDDEEDLNF